MCRTAVVTGGTGFVGSHLVERLLRDGWHVHMVVRMETDCEYWEKHKSARVMIHRHSVENSRLKEWIVEVQPDAVFHLASLFLAEHSSDDIIPLIEANILFGTQLADAVSQVKQAVFINTGTSWQHYENAEYNPVCLYAATKQAYMDILEYYRIAKKMRVLTLILFDTYGPADRRKKLIPFLMTCKENEALAMSPGEQRINLVYIDDVVEGFITAFKKMVQNELTDNEYILASLESLSLRDVVQICNEVRGIDIPVEWGAKKYREREVMRPWQSGLPLPGWKTSVCLREGLKRILCIDTL